MSKEKFISGKQDNGHHEGRAATLRRLAASDSELDIGLDILISQQIIECVAPDTELYRFHKARLDFWMRGLDKGDKIDLE